jgi:hypothetical protein
MGRQKSQAWCVVRDLPDASNGRSSVPKALKPDARITDVLETLAKPVDYVAGIYGSFIQNSFDKERSSVTIGVSGKGVCLHYSIIEPCESEEPGIEAQDVSLKITTNVRRRRVFNGQSHREILEDSFWGGMAGNGGRPKPDRRWRFSSP